MPRGEKGKRFKPGQSGNPHGRPKIPDDLKAIRKQGIPQVTLMLWRITMLTDDELKDEYAQGKLVQLEQLIASVYTEGKLRGCPQRLDAILNRLIGKVPENKNITALEIERPLAQLTNEELDEL